MSRERLRDILICLLALYNLYYGAICWQIAGINGLLLGSILITSGAIIGLILKNKK